MPPKNTTELLKQLRLLMRNVDIVKEPLEAYIVVSEDAHAVSADRSFVEQDDFFISIFNLPSQSEYIASCDNRRAFISGFDGSAGTAVITQTEALMYTDGRYYLQASEQLDKNWTLMKKG